MATIQLSVRSMDNYVYATATNQLFSIEGITRLQGNLNPASGAYNLTLPGESQFVYVEGQIPGVTSAHKYTVDDTLAEILAMFEAYQPAQ